MKRTELMKLLDMVEFEARGTWAQFWAEDCNLTIAQQDVTPEQAEAVLRNLCGIAAAIDAAIETLEDAGLAPQEGGAK